MCQRASESASFAECDTENWHLAVLPLSLLDQIAIYIPGTYKIL